MTEKKSPIISFKNFSFQYRAQKKPTLKEINLDIYPGERVLKKYSGRLHQWPESFFQSRRMQRGTYCG